MSLPNVVALAVLTMTPFTPLTILLAIVAIRRDLAAIRRAVECL